MDNQPITAPATDHRLDLAGMAAWARELMASREPDFVIGADYLRRWWVIPRNVLQNVYLHEFRASDDDRAFHDHPWANTSIVLEGGYIEHTPEGSFRRYAGDVISRPATALHRVELIDNQPAITLFMSGVFERDWGFACPQGWVPWQEFTARDDKGQIGKGCGEYEKPA